MSFRAAIFPDPVPRAPYRWYRPCSPRLSRSPEAQDGGHHTGAPAGRSPLLSARQLCSLSSLRSSRGWAGRRTALGETDQAGEDRPRKAFGSGGGPQGLGSRVGPVSPGRAPAVSVVPVSVVPGRSVPQGQRKVTLPQAEISRCLWGSCGSSFSPCRPSCLLSSSSSCS